MGAFLKREETENDKAGNNNFRKVMKLNVILFCTETDAPKQN